MSTAFEHSQATVTTSVTEIAEIAVGEQRLEVRNLGPATVYMGSGSVTVATGFPLHPGERYTTSVPVNFDAVLYGITASGTADVRAIAP